MENNTLLRCLHADPRTFTKEEMLKFLYTVYIKFKDICRGTEIYDTDKLLVANLDCWGGVDTPYSTPQTAHVCMAGAAYLMVSGRLWWEVNAMPPILPGMKFLDGLRTYTSWQIIRELGFRIPQLSFHLTSDSLLKNLEELFILNSDQTSTVLAYK